MSTRPARRSLAQAFSPAPDRASGLGDLLPPRAPARGVASAPAAPAPLTAVPDDAERGMRAPGLAASSSAGRPGAGPGHVGDPGDLAQVRNVAVYLPVALLERLKRTRRSRELTYADLLVEAAAAHLDDLDDLDGSAFHADSGPTVSGGMPVRSRRRQPEPGVQVQIRLNGFQVTWLDEQVSRLGAPSRTALVARLLEAHLT